MGRNRPLLYDILGNQELRLQRRPEGEAVPPPERRRRRRKAGPREKRERARAPKRRPREPRRVVRHGVPWPLIAPLLVALVATIYLLSTRGGSPRPGSLSSFEREAGPVAGRSTPELPQRYYTVVVAERRWSSERGQEAAAEDVTVLLDHLERRYRRVHALVDLEARRFVVCVDSARHRDELEETLELLRTESFRGRRLDDAYIRLVDKKRSR